MTISREPTPQKLVTDLEATELRIRKVLLYCFLENCNIYLMKLEVVFEEGSVPPTAEPSNIPEDATH
jgi:hypothetical protein